MIDTVREKLESLPGISGWKINYRETEGMEAYLVRDSLEMGRAKSVRTLTVTVYRDMTIDGTNRRGQAVTHIHPGSSAPEIERTLARAAEEAGYAVNEWYPLVKPGKRFQDEEPGTDETLPGRFENLLPELRRKGHGGKGGISFAELLLENRSDRILNSEGVDESFTSRAGYLECAAAWKEPEREEVEIFDTIQFSDAEPGMISQFLEQTLIRAKDRASAVPLTAEAVPVVLSGAAVPQFFTYFLFHVSSRSVYRKLSVAREGYPIQGDDIRGDRITLSIEPYMEGSPMNSPFDSDGLALERHILIQDGTVRRIAGDTQYSFYLGIEPTGSIGNMIISGGSLQRADLENEDRLEITDFSDFQTDFFSGNFGGEIRLGYLHRGSERLPVTGGSVSGSILTVKNVMKFSTEAARHENFTGPSFLRFDGLTISAG